MNSINKTEYSEYLQRLTKTSLFPFIKKLKQDASTYNLSSEAAEKANQGTEMVVMDSGTYDEWKDANKKLFRSKMRNMLFRTNFEQRRNQAVKRRTKKVSGGRGSKSTRPNRKRRSRAGPGVLGYQSVEKIRKETENVSNILYSSIFNNFKTMKVNPDTIHYQLQQQDRKKLSGFKKYESAAKRKKLLKKPSDHVLGDPEALPLLDVTPKSSKFLSELSTDFYSIESLKNENRDYQGLESSIISSGAQNKARNSRRPYGRVLQGYSFDKPKLESIANDSLLSLPNSSEKKKKLKKKQKRVKFVSLSSRKNKKYYFGKLRDSEVVKGYKNQKLYQSVIINKKENTRIARPRYQGKKIPGLNSTIVRAKLTSLRWNKTHQSLIKA